MLKNGEWVELSDLVARVKEIKGRGGRLVGVTPVPVEEGIELLYHFDQDLSWQHLCVRISGREPLPSVSSLYPGAFLPENEIQDQFGIRFMGLSPDYGTTFFLEDEADPSPVCRGISVRKEQQSDEEA